MRVTLARTRSAMVLFAGSGPRKGALSILQTLIRKTRSKCSSQIIETPHPLFADLPSEIVLEILTFAASISSRTAQNIALVARWTLPLAQKALYRTVLLSTSLQYYFFMRALGFDKELAGASNELLNELRRHVPILKVTSSRCYNNGYRNLVSDICLPRLIGTPRYIRREFASSLFASCINIRCVAIPGFLLRTILRSRTRAARAPDMQGEVMTNIEDLTLTSGAFRHDWDEFADTSHGRSFLSNLTHLWILDVVSYYLPLKLLVNLTHLAVPLRPFDSQQASETKDHSPRRLFIVSNEYLSHGRISMLVYHVPSKALRCLDDYMGIKDVGSFKASDLARIANSFDRRVYVVELEKSVACGLWESSARGGESIWTRAQQTLAIGNNS